ncbi:MAG: hypothetical protein AB1758_22955 [Candidatus Eremiobacterota bacterium]
MHTNAVSPGRVVRLESVSRQQVMDYVSAQRDELLREGKEGQAAQVGDFLRDLGKLRGSNLREMSQNLTRDARVHRHRCELAEILGAVAALAGTTLGIVCPVLAVVGAVVGAAGSMVSLIGISRAADHSREERLDELRDWSQDVVEYLSVGQNVPDGTKPTGVPVALRLEVPHTAFGTFE